MKHALIAVALVLLPGSAAADIDTIAAAMERDDAGAVAAFIADGGDIDAVMSGGRFDGSPLLHLAARVNATRSATLLIEAGARLDTRSRKSGATALHAAALQGNADLMDRLIAAGADPNALSNFGEAPLHHAVAFGHHKAVTVLLRHGADPNHSQSDEGPPIMITARMAHPPVRQALGLSPMPDPAGAIVRELIANGADVHARDARGDTVLDHWMYRICNEADTDGADIVDLLLDSGALLDKDKLRGFLDIGRSLDNVECDRLAPLVEQEQL